MEQYYSGTVDTDFFHCINSPYPSLLLPLLIPPLSSSPPSSPYPSLIPPLSFPPSSFLSSSLPSCSFLPPPQWANHGQSLCLEESTKKKIYDRIKEKVSAGSGTWIDWQYLHDAVALLRKVKGTPLGEPHTWGRGLHWAEPHTWGEGLHFGEPHTGGGGGRGLHYLCKLKCSK